jgi:uncharacterized membrane protein (DUF2068 family)
VLQLRQRKHGNRWLELIAAYKLLQAILLITVGIGALRLMGKDVGDILYNLAEGMHFNPEGKLISILLDQAQLIDDHWLRRLSLFMFGYAALGLLEGIGLMLEKVWAEYLTAIITASFLPLEILEIVHRITWFRVGLFAGNLAVLVYLVSHLVGRRWYGERNPHGRESLK